MPNKRTDLRAQFSALGKLPGQLYKTHKAGQAAHRAKHQLIMHKAYQRMRVDKAYSKKIRGGGSVY